MITAPIESNSEEASLPLLSDEKDCTDRSITKDEELSKVNKPSDIK